MTYFVSLTTTVYVSLEKLIFKRNVAFLEMECGGYQIFSAGLL